MPRYSGLTRGKTTCVLAQMKMATHHFVGYGQADLAWNLRLFAAIAPLLSPARPQSKLQTGCEWVGQFAARPALEQLFGQPTGNVRQAKRNRHYFLCDRLRVSQPR